MGAEIRLPLEKTGIGANFLTLPPPKGRRIKVRFRRVGGAISMVNLTGCGRALACAGLLLAAWTTAQAHPGGLNKEGCHNDRKNGGYHCHGATASYTVPRSSFGPASPTPSSAAPSPSSGGVFRNCDEARAAGAAPVRRGDPGYGSHLDRDNDGIGCEPYRGR